MRNLDNFGQIWNWLPEKLTTFSSMWWFFLLLPGGKQGFGPKQMMYTLVSRVGERVVINGVEHDGLAPRPVSEPFPAYTLGWLHDGEQMHDRLANHAGTAQVTPGQAVRAWTPEGYGGEIVPTGNGRPFGVEAWYKGPLGSAHFEAWGDPSSEVTQPHMVERYTPFGGANVLAWRRLRFEGEFTSPAGTETLAGYGYFQRICMDVMPFPWKWMWTLFADGSVFSCFVPYLGLHVLRRGDWFFPKPLENLSAPLLANAYFWDATTGDLTIFDRRVSVRVHPNSRYPNFTVHCTTTTGDSLTYHTRSYSHNQVIMERPLGRWDSLYNYNEYLFRVDDLTGRVAGRPLSPRTLGTGYGNCEYTWGLGL